jgi:hypothetical protein
MKGARRNEVLGNHRRQSEQRKDGVGAVSQRLIPTGKQSGLLMRIATTESGLSHALMIS